MSLTAVPHFADLVQHLEQCTFVVAVAWMLTLALRANRPAVRFWIWFLASAKFLIPFSILIGAGEWLHRAIGAPLSEPALVEVLRQMPLPLSSTTPPASADTHNTGLTSLVVAAIWGSIWGCGSLILVVRWWFQWRKVRDAVRNAVPSGLVANVPVLLTSSLAEPAVCGLIRPVMLLPVKIRNTLSHDQLSAILSHEMSHVRRRDNLLFALHMAVQTLFWFHPLVWWIGSHLVEERERACDEATISAGNDATVYAQSILNVCKCCVASSPVWAAGIAGADLSSRIRRIVSGRAGLRLSRQKVALLTLAGLATVAIPIGVGIVGTAETASGLQDSTAGNLRFEVAAIKPGRPSPRGSGVFINGRRFEVIDTKLEMLISFAYGLHPRQIVGAPDWIDKDEFDITAIAEEDVQPTAAQWKEMMQKLLADRFNLRLHRDTRMLPVYMLTVVRGGAKITRSEDDPAALPMVFFPGQWGKLVARNAGMKDFAAQIQSAVLDRPVVDKTGLPGRYDFTLSWTPDESQFAHINERIPPPADPANAPPPLFTALQEELGLKLEAGNARADVIVVDRLEKPTPN